MEKIKPYLITNHQKPPINMVFIKCIQCYLGTKEFQNSNIFRVEFLRQIIEQGRNGSLIILSLQRTGVGTVVHCNNIPNNSIMDISRGSSWRDLFYICGCGCSFSSWGAWRAWIWDQLEAFTLRKLLHNATKISSNNIL